MDDLVDRLFNIQRPELTEEDVEAQLMFLGGDYDAVYDRHRVAVDDAIPPAASFEVVELERPASPKRGELRNADKRLLEGAKHQKEGEKALSKKQLKKDKEELQKEVDRLTTSLDEATKKMKELEEELRKLKQTALQFETSAHRATTRRDAAIEAVRNSCKGRDLKAARENRTENDRGVAHRKVIDETSPLHPDYKCGLCRRRRMAETFDPKKFPQLEDLSAYDYTSMRQCAAALDVRQDDSLMSHLLEDNEYEKKISRAKAISRNSWILAYTIALCKHQIPARREVNKRGVMIQGEDDVVSDAISEVLMTESARKARKGIIALIPADSCVWKARGLVEEIDMTKYTDEHSLRQHMQSMETADCFPQSLVILIKCSFSKDSFTTIKDYCKEIVAKFSTTIYLSADLQSSAAPEDLKDRRIVENVNLLTEWTCSSPPVNLVILSYLSPKLFGFSSLSFLFKVVDRDSKVLFENAVKHIVDGTPFSLATIRERQREMERMREDAIPMKRARQDNSWGSSWNGGASTSQIHKSSQISKRGGNGGQGRGRGGYGGGGRGNKPPVLCYICQSPSHKCVDCPLNRPRH